MRKKRKYVPKTKGCYQCSQRRIHCDRTEPRCKKCSSRGISCSGLGIRYRFNIGVASRGRMSGREAFEFHCCSGQSKDAHLITLDSTKSVIAEAEGDNSTRSLSSERRLQTPDLGLNTQHQQAESILKRKSASEDQNEPMHQGADISSDVLPQRTIVPASTDALATLPGWQEYLLQYFSDHVAPEMVIIDDGHNGWRSLLLPIARTDPLVMEAVLAAAGSHFSANVNNFTFQPTKHYTNAIGELRRTRSAITLDIDTKQRACLTMIALLTAVMVNGSTDFPILFRALQSAFCAIGGESALVGSELSDFLIRQIRKLQLYGTPLVDTDKGAAIIRSMRADAFECIRYYERLHPTYSHTFSTITALIQQACDIYLLRAEDAPLSPQYNSHVSAYRNALTLLPPDAPFAHVLIWSTFIFAAESTTTDDQRFFEQYLMQHYRRSGFENIPLAVSQLQRIWSRNSTQNWTSLLPQLQIFIM